MRSVSKPLLRLTAADLMNTNITAIPREMLLQAAARLMHRAEVSGAPVVDGQGRCIGVISASDFMARAGQSANGGHPAAIRHEGAYSAWQIIDVERLPAGEVGALMSKEPVTIHATLPIGEVAQRMVDAHVHRLVVVDGAGRPQGIVSSTDLMAALARAARQPAAKWNHAGKSG